MCDMVLKVKYLNLGVENIGEIDMEVDMEGGKECGVLDKVVKWYDIINLLLIFFLFLIGGNIRILIVFLKVMDFIL